MRGKGRAMRKFFTREVKENRMSWFVNRVWPRCRAIVVVGIVAWVVMEPSGIA